MKDKTSTLVAVLAISLVLGLFMRIFVSREGFAQKSVGMPIGDSMGQYDGLDLSTSQNLWSSQPKPTPLKPYESANDNELFQYQESKFTPECCPSSITNDVGCLCATKKEEREWLTRGGNRTDSTQDIMT